MKIVRHWTKNETTKSGQSSKKNIEGHLKIFKKKTFN